MDSSIWNCSMILRCAVLIKDKVSKKAPDGLAKDLVSLPAEKPNPTVVGSQARLYMFESFLIHATIWFPLPSLLNGVRNASQPSTWRTTLGPCTRRSFQWRRWWVSLSPWKGTLPLSPRLNTFKLAQWIDIYMQLDGIACDLSTYNSCWIYRPTKVAVRLHMYIL